MAQPLDLALDPALAAAAQVVARLAVRGGAPADQAAGQPEGRRRQARDLRDRLRPVRPAAHRHLRRGGAHQHGAPRLRGADRGPPQDPPRLLLRRHGRPAQGAGQRAQQGHAGGAHRQAAVVAFPIPSATSIRASPRTTTRACAASSTASASSTSSCRPPSATRPASSTRRCCGCSRSTTR